MVGDVKQRKRRARGVDVQSAGASANKAGKFLAIALLLLAAIAGASYLLGNMADQISSPLSMAVSPARPRPSLPAQAAASSNTPISVDPHLPGALNSHPSTKKPVPLVQSDKKIINAQSQQQNIPIVQQTQQNKLKANYFKKEERIYTAAAGLKNKATHRKSQQAKATINTKSHSFSIGKVPKP